MTRGEALTLYQTGLEPTVTKLLELAAAAEQLRLQLQTLGSRQNNTLAVDPARPSAMTPTYEKPSSKGKRRKTPGRKHESRRRPA